MTWFSEQTGPIGPQRLEQLMARTVEEAGSASAGGRDACCCCRPNHPGP